MKTYRYLIIFLFLFSKSFSQTEKIEEIKKSYEIKFDKINNDRLSETKSLSINDYSRQKQIVNNKYDSIIRELIKERDNKIYQIQQVIERKNKEKYEAQRKLEEQKTAQEEKENVNQEEEEPIYNVAGVEVKPEPIGGIEKFNTYVNEKISLTQIKISEENIGKMFLQFIVEKDGKLTDIKIIKSLNTEIDEAVKKIVSESPNWQSAFQNGSAVKCSYVLGIWITKNN